MATYKKIIEYCIHHSDKTSHEDGSIVLSDSTNIDSLGINFARLTREEARGLAVGLSYTLIQGKMNMMVTSDQVKFWDSVGKHLLEPPSLYFGESFNSGPLLSELSHLRKLLITVIKTETREWQIFEDHKISGWSWPTCVPGYPADTVRPGEYFVYPLLEAILNRTLSDYVESDGIVIKEFTIDFSNGKSKTYGVNDTVSNMSHLFLLLFQSGYRQELTNDLKLLFGKIETIYEGSSALDVIYKVWRNSALHGEEHTSTASGIVLNIVLLFAIASVSEKEWTERHDA
jgi:hypothetical protein